MAATFGRHEHAPSLAIGAFLYILLYTLLGYFLGPAVLRVLEEIHLPLGLLGSLVPLVVLLVWIIRARRGLHLRRSNEAGLPSRRDRWRDGAVARGLATVVSTLAMNVLIHAGGDLALLAPGEVVERAQARLAVLAVLRVIGPVLLLAGVPAFIAIGVGWGIAYAQWAEPHFHWPDWLNGLCFALVPLCVALVVVLPLLDGAAPELGRLGPLAAGSEALRHAIYGATLGLIYPLRVARFGGRGAAAALVPSVSGAGSHVSHASG